jgi:hypothetical protein
MNFFNPKTLVHGMPAIAQEAPNVIRLGREGDGSWTFASDSAESNELVARPEYCTMEQRVQRVCRPNRVDIKDLQEGALLLARGGRG